MVTHIIIKDLAIRVQPGGLLFTRCAFGISNASWRRETDRGVRRDFTLTINHRRCSEMNFSFS